MQAQYKVEQGSGEEGRKKAEIWINTDSKPVDNHPVYIFPLLIPAWTGIKVGQDYYLCTGV